jgi:hypothetical protein
MPVAGQTYSWTPTTGLDYPTRSNPLAGHSSVAMTERYIRQRDVPVVEGPAWTEKDATKKA